MDILDYKAVALFSSVFGEKEGDKNKEQTMAYSGTVKKPWAQRALVRSLEPVNSALPHLLNSAPANVPVQDPAATGAGLWTCLLPAGSLATPATQVPPMMLKGHGHRLGLGAEAAIWRAWSKTSVEGQLSSELVCQSP